MESELAGHAMLLKEGFKGPRVLADMPCGGDKLGAAGAEQPDVALPLLIHVDDAAELLAAASTGAPLCDKRGLKVTERDAVLSHQPLVASGFATTRAFVVARTAQLALLLFSVVAHFQFSLVGD